MLHRFCLNLSNKLKHRGVFITPLILFLLFPSLSFPQGLYTSFSETITSEKSSYTLLLKKYVNNSFDLEKTQGLSSVQINQKYLTYIITHSPNRYSRLASTDKCSLYDLFNTNLLRSPLGYIQKILIDYKDSNNQSQTSLISKDVFFNQIATKQCPKFEQFSRHFNLKNLKNTLKSISLGVPKSEKECLKNLYTFQKDVKSPYLCSIAETVKLQNANERTYNNLNSVEKSRNKKLKEEINKSKIYKKIMTKKGISSLIGFCNNLDNPILYCKNYFRKSLWMTLNKTKKDSIFFKSLCDGKKRKACIRELNSDISTCHYRGTKFTSLFPKPNCNSLSRSFLKTRLNDNYNDCPSTIKNESMIGFSRILNHFDAKTLNSKHSCNLNTIYPFAKFNMDYLDFNSWQVQICYKDILIGNEQACLPTVFGEVENSPLSITNVIQKITYRLKGNNNKCRVIEKKSYNPALLKYKAGCYIINDFRKCSGEDCDFKVLLDGKQFKNFTVDYKLKFDLFPSSYTAENKSLKNQFMKIKKKSFKPVKNTTILKRTLEQNKETIVFGMGCIEDLLPSFFKRGSFNQCNPTTFIIDGLIEDGGRFATHIRTSVDHIHAPRIIPWARVFESVKQYQKIHPLRTWKLYAIK